MKDSIPDFSKSCGTFMGFSKTDCVRNRCLEKTADQQILIEVFHIEFKQTWVTVYGVQRSSMISYKLLVWLKTENTRNL